jgi:hypothetical protein
VFDSNSVELGDGAGAYIYSDSVVSASITNNIFNANVSSANGGGLGASACRFNIDYVITNNTFTLNTANENGGGMSFSAMLGDVPPPPPPTPQSFVLDLYNNIVVDNFSAGNGDDLFIVEDSFPGRNLDIGLFNNDYSDLFITCEQVIGCLPELNKGNNINEDPLFVDAAAGDVSLKPDSPCIDAGDPNAPDVLNTDFFGNPRVLPTDMGAVEFIPPVVDLHGDGGGCSIARSPVMSSLAVFIAIPVLILIRRFFCKHLREIPTSRR